MNVEPRLRYHGDTARDAFRLSQGTTGTKLLLPLAGRQAQGNKPKKCTMGHAILVRYSSQPEGILVVLTLQRKYWFHRGPRA